MTSLTITFLSFILLIIVSSGCRKVRASSIKLNTFLTEARATLTCFIPNAVRWFYRIFLSGKITSHTITYLCRGSTKNAFLYLHEGPELSRDKSVSPVLLLHGDYSHPLTMLPLAEVSQNAGVGPVFSVYLPYNDENPEIHQRLLKMAIDKIEELLISAGRSICGIIAVGHSKGAIEAANQAFVEKNPKIKAVISISGRLRDVPSLHMPCSKLLKPLVNKIYQSIVENPLLPLYQIVSGQDWNAPREAMAVRVVDDCCHIVENSMHFNILYHEETHSKLDYFLRK